MPITMTSTLTPSKDVAFREIDREVVILDLDSGSYFGLNEIASRAWAIVLEQKTLAGVHAALLKEYDVVPDRLQQDLLEWAGKLVDKRLLCAD
jgi:hypothetical protein